MFERRTDLAAESHEFNAERGIEDGVITRDEMRGGIKVTVKKPDGSFAVAEDGTTLNNADASKNYALKYSMAGKYEIAYSVSDTNGRYGGASTKSAYVMDDIAPEFTLKSAMPTSGSKGKKISIPDITISAGSGKTVNYYIVLIEPSYLQTLLYSTTRKEQGVFEFTPTRAGDHILRYCVYDQYGNITLKDYIIKVS